MRGGLFNKDSDEEEIMADAVVVEEEFTDAATAVSQGKRNLLVKDYDGAVAALAQGCSMLAEKHGDTADELGEPFLIYGRALLCLARQEAGVLGNGVPGTDEAEEDDEEGEEEAESSAKKKVEEAADKSSKEAKAEDKPAEEVKATEESEKKKAVEEVKPEEKKAEQEASSAAPEPAASSSSTSMIEPVAGSSKLNGEASTSKVCENGDAHENGDEEDGEDEDEEDEDSGSNLQVAWEVLELAKLILLKRGSPGWKHLAEAHRLLGEVAMESGNQGEALTDLNACLDLLRKIEPADARSMAEVHYQLGLAHSLTNDFDGSIEQFQEAVSLLETRITELQEMTEAPKSEDPSYTIAGEIKELKELLPEIQEKIGDMRDFKQQATESLIEGIKRKVVDGSCSNGAGPSGEGTSSSSIDPPKDIKPASDISHLVRKKRKTDDDTESSSDSQASPCKKPLTEKTA